MSPVSFEDAKHLLRLMQSESLQAQVNGEEGECFELRIKLSEPLDYHTQSGFMDYQHLGYSANW